MNKAELRENSIRQRSLMPLDEMRDKSARIAVRMQSAINWAAVKRIHVYRSHEPWREVDTGWVEAFVYTMWPNIEVVIGDVSKTATIPVGVFDLIIVPVVVFDERLHRLGFGGGWYDRFLLAHPRGIKMGFAYDFQEMPRVPNEAHDIPLDYIVTESRLLTK